MSSLQFLSHSRFAVSDGIQNRKFHFPSSIAVFHFFHKWRYERSQRREAFKLPKGHSAKMGLGFGDYLSGQSRIGSLGAYDLLNRRKKRLKWALGIAGVALAIWLFVELIYAVSFYAG
ncbi:MAG: hypothetical protein ACPGN3_13400 [Opitutales bacterium]